MDTKKYNHDYYCLYGHISNQYHYPQRSKLVVSIGGLHMWQKICKENQFFQKNDLSFTREKRSRRVLRFLQWMWRTFLPPDADRTHKTAAWRGVPGIPFINNPTLTKTYTSFT